MEKEVATNASEISPFQECSSQAGTSSVTNHCQGSLVDNPQQGTRRGLQIATKKGRDNGTPRIPPTVKDKRKLFVGGLPQDVTLEEFRALFENFGVIADSVVMMDRETERSRGFGFVTFEDQAVAKLILAMGKDDKKDGSGYLEMRGKLVEIKSAEPKPVASTTTGRRSGRGNRKKGNNTVGNRRAHPTAPVYPMALNPYSHPPSMLYMSFPAPLNNPYGNGDLALMYGSYTGADDSFGMDVHPYYYPCYHYYPYIHAEQPYQHSPPSSP